MAIGQQMAQGMSNGIANANAAANASAASATPASDADAPEVRLEKLKGLLDKGLIAQSDFDSAKAEVLKRLVG